MYYLKKAPWGKGRVHCIWQLKIEVECQFLLVLDVSNITVYNIDNQLKSCSSFSEATNDINTVMELQDPAAAFLI